MRTLVAWMEQTHLVAPRDDAGLCCMRDTNSIRASVESDPFTKRLTKEEQHTQHKQMTSSSREIDTQVNWLPRAGKTQCHLVEIGGSGLRVCWNVCKVSWCQAELLHYGDIDSLTSA